MPQLDPEFFLSQLFWLVVTFSFLLIFLWKITLPRISSALEKREGKINDDIQSAKKLQLEAEKIQSEIQVQIQQANDQAASLIRESSMRLQNKNNERLKDFDKELQAKIESASNEINKNKNESLSNINKQTIDITKMIISKFTSIKVSENDI